MKLIVILLWAVFCFVASLMFARIAIGAEGVALAFVFSLAMGLGYAYGTIQMMYLYKAKIEAAIKDLSEK